jgi:hypothetical protein
VRRHSVRQSSVLTSKPASDPAQNPYWKRDVRRVYPKLSVVTQSGLSSLLIQHSSALSCVVFHSESNLCLFAQPSVAPPADGAEAKASVPAAIETSTELSQAIQTLASKGVKQFSMTNLPPRLPTAFERWVPEKQPDAPHEEHSYFPMILVK